MIPLNDAAAAGEPAEGAVNPDLPSTIESVGSVTAIIILDNGALCIVRRFCATDRFRLGSGCGASSFKGNR
jgi:hypothetical protein